MYHINSRKIVALDISVTSNYYFSRMLQGNLINPGDPLTYSTIKNINDFWLYTETIFLPSLLKENVVPNTTVFKDNVLIGVPRLRQIRVRNDSCTFHRLVRKHFRQCYGFYEPDDEDKETYHTAEGNWRYEKPNDVTDERFSWGLLATYPAGGFVQLFNKDLTESLKIVNVLKTNWIDRGTRVVFIEFTIYNSNNNLFCVAK